jgi:hypothetical protein
VLILPPKSYGAFNEFGHVDGMLQQLADAFGVLSHN